MQVVARVPCLVLVGMEFGQVKERFPRKVSPA
mgnify:FL=1